MIHSYIHVFIFQYNPFQGLTNWVPKCISLQQRTKCNREMSQLHQGNTGKQELQVSWPCSYFAYAGRGGYCVTVCNTEIIDFNPIFVGRGPPPPLHIFASILIFHAEQLIDLYRTTKTIFPYYKRFIRAFLPKSWFQRLKI